MAQIPGEIVSGTWVTDTGATITGRHYTVKGLATLLGVSRATVLYHIRAGHIPHHRAGRSLLIPTATARKIKSGYQPNKTWPTTTPTAKDHPRDPTEHARE